MEFEGTYYDHPARSDLTHRILDSLEQAREQALDQPLFELTKIGQPTWKMECTRGETRHRERTYLNLLKWARVHVDFSIAQIAKKIGGCKPSKPCNSPFCPFCRNNIQKDAVKTGLAAFSDTPSERMGFLTVLFESTCSPENHMASAIQECRQKLDDLFHRRLAGARMYGAFEIDVKRRADLSGKTYTKKVLEGLGMPEELIQDHAFVIHFHAIIDRGSHSEIAIKNAFKSIYKGSYQVKLQNLYETKTKEQNIETMARYMFKFRTQFSDNIHGRDELKTRYHSFFGRDLLVQCVKGVHRVMEAKGIASMVIKKGL